jgi:predicted N-acetyltransferase YhbS
MLRGRFESSSQTPMTSNVHNRPLTPADLPQVSHLNARVFGPGRFTRTAYRVREGAPLISRYCRAAFAGNRMIAAVRFTEITIGGAGEALLLGPLAVDAEFAGQGFGRRLIGEALAAARENGVRLVVLVGDEPYYARFGFRPVPVGQIVLPGPVNPKRLLAAELQPGALQAYRGPVAAKRA